MSSNSPIKPHFEIYDPVLTCSLFSLPCHLSLMTGNHESDSPNSSSFYKGDDSGGECGIIATTLLPQPGTLLTPHICSLYSPHTSCVPPYFLHSYPVFSSHLISFLYPSLISPSFVSYHASTNISSPCTSPSLSFLFTVLSTHPPPPAPATAAKPWWSYDIGIIHFVGTTTLFTHSYLPTFINVPSYCIPSHAPLTSTLFSFTID